MRFTAHHDGPTIGALMIARLESYLKRVVHGETRSGFYKVVLGIWFCVAGYAILHDQYLVRLAPEHFTVYHPNPRQIASAPLLAGYIALKASVSPGLVLGIVTWFVARGGEKRKLSLKCIFASVLALIAVAEVCALLSGAIVYLSQQTLYPAGWYPSGARPMLISQTIQITCYFVGFLGSGIMLFWMSARRGEVPS